MSMRAMRSVVLVVLTLGGIGTAAADWSIDLGLESFRWREFDAGAQLLEETGPRLRIGTSLRQPLGLAQRDLFQLNGALYLGNIDYDGQACTLSGVCTPFKTDADYTGVLVEGIFTRLLGTPSAGEVFVGGGLDTWRRDIKGSSGVSGAIEDWTVIYLLAGAGTNWTSPDARFHLRGGLKYPIYTANLPDSFSVTLRPKGRASLFARLGTDFIRAGRARWGLDLYYDSYRFATSDVEQVGSVLVFQPQSKQDIVGISTTIYLD
jgi:hypothetical protein